MQERKNLYCGTAVRFLTGDLPAQCVLRFDIAAEQKNTPFMWQASADTDETTDMLNLARRYALKDKECVVLCPIARGEMVDVYTGLPQPQGAA